MASLNKVMLIGKLGKDPEIRYSANGTAFANFSLATDDRRKGANGEWIDTTEWHNIVMAGKLAEIAGKHLAKGAQVYVEGKLQTRKWQDKDGRDRYSTEVFAEKMVMLGGKRAEVAPDGGGEDDLPDIPF